MASFSSSLEQALRRALQYANERSHEYATLEHLLLSLLDDRDAAAVMRACDVDIDLLRDKLTGYLDNELAGLVLDSHNDAQPTAGFQRVIHRAVAHVQRHPRQQTEGVTLAVNGVHRPIGAPQCGGAAYRLQVDPPSPLAQLSIAKCG